MSFAGKRAQGRNPAGLPSRDPGQRSAARGLHQTCATTPEGNHRNILMNLQIASVCVEIQKLQSQMVHLRFCVHQIMFGNDRFSLRDV